jgi:hypothetical protein
MTQFMTVTGLTELRARLGGAVILCAQALEVTEEALAREIEARAKELCPVDTGTLRDSIQAQPVSDTGRAPSGGTVFDGQTFGGGQFLPAAARSAWMVSSDVEYAPYVEYGTSGDHAIDAQPYMRPAADSVNVEAAATVGAGVLRKI